MQQHMSPHDQYRQPFVARIDGGDAVDGYDWTEMVWDRTEYVEPDSPRTGVASLFGLNGAAAAVNQLVTARFRAVSPEGDPTFVFGDGGNAPQVARVTGVPSAGLYPAVLTSYDQDAATWSDADTVQLLPLNGEAMPLGLRAIAIPAGGAPTTPPTWLAVVTCCGDPAAPADCYCPPSATYCVTLSGMSDAALNPGSVPCAELNRTFSMSFSYRTGTVCYWVGAYDTDADGDTDVIASLSVDDDGYAVLDIRAYAASNFESRGVYTLLAFDCDGSNVMSGSGDANYCDGWPASVTVTVGPCDDGDSAVPGAGCGDHEATAAAYEVTVSGISGGTGCTDYNATHTMDVIYTCDWADSPTNPLARLQYLAGPDTWYLSFGSGDATYSCADADFVPLGSSTFSLVSSGALCSGWAATLTVTAVP